MFGSTSHISVVRKKHTIQPCWKGETKQLPRSGGTESEVCTLSGGRTTPPQSGVPAFPFLPPSGNQLCVFTRKMVLGPTLLKVCR